MLINDKIYYDYVEYSIVMLEIFRNVLYLYLDTLIGV